MVSQATQIAVTAVPFLAVNEKDTKSIPASALESDISPELLAMEAERLGISSGNEKDILMSIRKEMEQQKIQSQEK